MTEVTACAWGTTMEAVAVAHGVCVTRARVLWECSTRITACSPSTAPLYGSSSLTDSWNYTHNNIITVIHINYPSFLTVSISSGRTSIHSFYMSIFLICHLCRILTNRVRSLNRTKLNFNIRPNARLHMNDSGVNSTPAPSFTAPTKLSYGHPQTSLKPHADYSLVTWNMLETSTYIQWLLSLSAEKLHNWLTSVIMNVFKLKLLGDLNEGSIVLTSTPPILVIK